jgi:hypothetical protein
LVTIAITPPPPHVLSLRGLNLFVGLGGNLAFEHAKDLRKVGGSKGGSGLQKQAISGVYHHEFKAWLPVVGAPEGLGYDHLAFAGELGGFHEAFRT